LSSCHPQPDFGFTGCKKTPSLSQLYKTQTPKPDLLSQTSAVDLAVLDIVEPCIRTGDCLIQVIASLSGIPVHRALQFTEHPFTSPLLKEGLEHVFVAIVKGGACK
jgi:hypothetical protein